MLITNVYDELKELADANKKKAELTERFLKKCHIDGLDLSNIFLIKNCKVTGDALYHADGEKLSNSGNTEDNHIECFEDFYRECRTCYFATHETGTYIAVHIEW